MTAQTKTCVMTGATGFVGNGLAKSLRGNDWRVIEWTRSPAGKTDAVPFRLGQNIDPTVLKGAEALVHCAYDFAPRKWSDIVETNVRGSEKLFQAARAAGVKRVVFISTLSAFPGCRSLYGKAKLQIESLAQSISAWTIRPGLVYGDNPGGMFGRLAAQVKNSRVVPVLCGGVQTQYLVHQEDLAKLVLGIIGGQVPPKTEPISIAHEQGLPLKEILSQIAAALGRRITFAPVPWQFAWLGLKTLELAGAKTNFKSDSLISIIYQDTHPSFALLNSLGFACRPFRVPQLPIRQDQPLVSGSS